MSDPTEKLPWAVADRNITMPAAAAILLPKSKAAVPTPDTTNKRKASEIQEPQALPEIHSDDERLHEVDQDDDQIHANS
ncbi:hypothetical protein NHQ30_007400 [Ciborinia camelliae]|nr:hypothetical protein NHQ30_007400 [Ciborinia camelliae]